MENQAMSSCSSSSSSPTPETQKLKGIAESKEESKEMQNNPKDVPSHELSSESRTRSPRPEAVAVQKGKEMIEIVTIDPSSSNKLYNCTFCKKQFLSAKALGGHQNAHRHRREWKRKHMEKEAYFPGLGFMSLSRPHLFLGGFSQDALSNENHLGITLNPVGSLVCPSFNNGVTRGTMGMNVPMVPRVTPTGFFTGNPVTYGSSSRAPQPLPSYRNTGPLIPRGVAPFSPPQTTNNLSSNLFSNKNVLAEEDFISKIGVNNIVKIDEPEEGESKTWGNDLSLSL